MSQVRRSVWVPRLVPYARSSPSQSIKSFTQERGPRQTPGRGRVPAREGSPHRSTNEGLQARKRTAGFASNRSHASKRSLNEDAASYTPKQKRVRFADNGNGASKAVIVCLSLGSPQAGTNLASFTRFMLVLANSASRRRRPASVDLVGVAIHAEGFIGDAGTATVAGPLLHRAQELLGRTKIKSLTLGLTCLIKKVCSRIE